MWPLEEEQEEEGLIAPTRGDRKTRIVADVAVVVAGYTTHENSETVIIIFETALRDKTITPFLFLSPSLSRIPVLRVRH